MKLIYEDDIQVVYESESGSRITTLKVNDPKYHFPLCGCSLCWNPDDVKKE